MIEHDDQALDVDQDVDDVADFDAFFAEQAQPRRGVSLRLFGRTYTLPSTLPALYMLQLHRLKNSTNPEDIHRLLAPLFGPDAVAHWSDNGMDDRQLGIVLMWATANLAAPGSLSMGQAAAEYDRREAAKGKAPAATTRPKPKARPKKRRGSGRR
ncbi:tail assembly chaperone [Streptomyces phage Picard]|uniref:Tail assembly chaperone n=1 Tax=Streptomyces phage Picard TaxID=1920311 RepID=A0A1J0MBZ3_9CAUD|nr:tail assembly chaperone [Streptomyces phage Picard]APD18545.1 tail assembly chaperone [Streptomyces phage Picard]